MNKEPSLCDTHSEGFSVLSRFLTSKCEISAKDKEKSAGILPVRRAFLTQSGAERSFFEAVVPYVRSPDGLCFLHFFAKTAKCVIIWLYAAKNGYNKAFCSQNCQNIIN